MILYASRTEIKLVIRRCFWLRDYHELPHKGDGNLHGSSVNLVMLESGTFLLLTATCIKGKIKELSATTNSDCSSTHYKDICKGEKDRERHRWREKE